MRCVMLLLSVLAVLPLAAQVTVTGEGKKGNPTVRIQNITGNAETASRIVSDFRYCGWLDVVRGNASDYIVSGNAGENSASLTVSNGAGTPMYTVTAQGTDAAKTAHAAVDAVLKKEFGIPGICRTKIVFAAEVGKNKKEIYLCDFDGRNITKLTNNNTLSIEPSWHPNGRAILYNQFLVSSTPLVEYDLVNNRSRALVRQNGLNAGRISPDGKKIAFVVSVGNQMDLYVRDVEGGNLKRLTNDRAVEASPAWSPDSREICYVSNVNGRPRLYIISAAGGTPRRVPGVLGSESVSPAWSKDNKLAYAARLGAYTLKVLDLSGVIPGYTGPKGESALIADSSAPAVEGESPSWAPDNRHVVLSNRGTIYVVDTRTNRKRVLVSGKSKCNGAYWSPILY